MMPITERINVFGADLNGGRGFENFKAAKATWDMDKIPYGTLWKIDGIIYDVIKLLGKPMFEFYQE
jgi:hypothetical protein